MSAGGSSTNCEAFGRRRVRLRRGAARLCLAAVAASLLAILAPASAGAELVLGPGGWSYFGDPRAVHAGGRTFIGWADTDGYIRLATLDDGRVVQQRRLGPRLSVDDHNNPSIYVRPDGRLSIFYSDHSGPRMYMRTTRYPYSFRSISGADTLPTNTSGRRGYTYPNPVRASKRLWLFFRGGNWQPNYSVRLPGRWSRARTLVWGPRERRDGKLYQHRPYAKYDTDGRTIKATFTEGNEGAYRNSVYYAEVRPGDGLYTARGRRVSRLGDPPAVTRLDRVRGPSSGQWALDIAADRGRPVIVYRRGGGPREYWYARHDGERWRNYKITSFDRTRQGQVASITLDHETPNTVYLSNMGSRGRLEIEVWVTPDRGRTWIRRAITRGSRVDNFRPVSPRNLTGREEVAWFAGSRTHYRDFDTDVIVQLVRAAQRIAEGLGLANDDSGEGAAR